VTAAGIRFARYAAGLRAIVEALWLSVYSLLAAIIVNLAIPATSQGAELIDSLSDAPNRFAAILTLLASAVYCAAACAASSALAIHYGRLRKTARPAILRARRAVPYWLAAVVLLSCGAVVFPLGFLAITVPFVLVASVLALPLLGAGRPAPRTPPIRAISLATACLAVLGFAVCLAIVFWPVSAARGLGAWPIVYLAAGFWTIVGTLTFVVLPKRVGLPAMMLVPPLIFGVLSSYNDNHRIRGASAPAGSVAHVTTLPLDSHFDAWLRAACVPSPRPCPVYLAAAQGGGARAAYWSASILQALDERTRGRFTHHLFAISAVSGGALGAAAFVAAKADAAGRPAAAARPPLRAFLAGDYLSPIAAALVFPDFIARFVPFPLPRFDRAVAFETALEHSWRVAFHTDRFSQDLSGLYAGAHGDELPSLLLNATNVETGKRFIVSNLSFSQIERGDAYYAYDPEAAYSITSMPLSTAVHLGARFPFVSPHGVLDDSPAAGGIRTPWGRLVDGGYYDNSGTATLSDLLDALVRHVATRPAAERGIVPEFVVLVISNDVDEPAGGNDERAFASRRLPFSPPEHMMRVYRSVGEEPQHSLQLSELNSPIEALLSARGAHAEAEMHHLMERVDDLATEGGLNCAMARHRMRATCVPIPVFQEYSYARVLASDDFDDLMHAMSHGTANRHALVQLIKPGLGWTLSARSRHALDQLSVEAVARQSTSEALLR
jgi:hypothetical protein